MPPTQSETWDIGRFWQTLDFFGELPVISWFQTMFFPAPPLPPPVVEAGYIFDFRCPSDTMAEIWGSVDDVVMGGVSASRFTLTPEGALFAGEVSTQNSGGFASVRSRNFSPPLNLQTATGQTPTGITLRVKGDGQRYKFLVRDAAGWDRLAYAYSFDTVAGAWITVQIPFAQMQPVFRAKTVPDAPPLNSAQIYALQLMLSKFEYDGQLNPQFQPGAFNLLVESIGVY
ncbi:MAG: CIA30 family protein [Spirulina sp. SIO3F2]|nr:CIA30 family protein [Spirulina sp. SIO3F2]